MSKYRSKVFAILGQLSGIIEVVRRGPNVLAYGTVKSNPRKAYAFVMLIARFSS